MVSLAVAAWWALSVPWRPMAVYEAMPDTVTAVSRHVGVEERWDGLSANPLVLAVAKAAGASECDVRGLGEDEESRAWMAKLTGREAVLGYRPGGAGREEAWFGAAWIGGGAQRLRWQLQLFRVPGYTRMNDWPGHSAWLVDGVDAGDGRVLAISFGEGTILAALSRDPLALGEVLRAVDGHRRLVEASGDFRAWAQGDDRSTPDRGWAGAEAESAELELAEVTGTTLRGTVRGPWGAAGRVSWPGEDAGAAAGAEQLGAVLGEAPCAVVGVARGVVSWAASHPGTDPMWAHALRMVLAAGGARVTAAVLDGEYSGHLAFGLMRAVGLGGLRVPTLLLATPTDGGETVVRRKLQAVLDSCNARYRAAFVMAPAGEAGGAKCWALESAGGDEWVDALAQKDRPAFAVADGWLYVASNLAALRRVLEGAGRRGAGGAPRWVSAARDDASGWAWVDLERGGKSALDLLGVCSIAARWMPQDEDSPDWQALLAELRGWVRAVSAFGEGRAAAGRTPGAGDGWVDVRFDLGLPGAAAGSKMAP